jgi:hypothetical protein
MLCPSLGSERDYRGWIEEAGFMISEFRDLTRNVERTWHLSAGLLERFKLSTLLPFVEPGSRRFLEAFDLMRQAYAGGAMAYGLFAARKPA